MTAGGALIMIGAVLPWVSVVSIFGTINVAGTTGDGQIALILGAAVIGFGLLKPKGGRITTLIASLAAGALYGYEWANITDKSSEAEDFISASVGYGIYVGIAGSVLAIAVAAERINQGTP